MSLVRDAYLKAIEDQGFTNIRTEERKIYGTNITLILADFPGVDLVSDKENGTYHVATLDANCGFAIYKANGGTELVEFGAHLKGFQDVVNALENKWEGDYDKAYESHMSEPRGASDGLTDFGDGVLRKR